MASIQTVYVALFGRPADPAGLAFFNAATSNGANLTAIGDLAATSEYQSRFTGKSNTQIITDIYMSLFGHAPDAAGLAFFVDALNTGSQNINTIAINIADGAQGADKTLLEKKVAAADLFTAELDTPVEIGNYTGLAAAAKGVAFLTAVTATSPTVDKAAAAAAVADIPNTGGTSGVAGVTIATDGTAAQAVSPTNANPAFKSTSGDDTINASALATTTSVDAGAGADVLNATGTFAGAPTLKGAEKVFATATANSSIAMTNATGVSELWSKGSKTFTVDFTDVAATTTVGFDSNGTANTGAATVEYKAADVTGSSDTVNIAFKAHDMTGGAGLKIDATANAVETVAISNSGATKLINVDTGTATTKVMLTGSGSVTEDATGVIANLKTFDAGAFKGQINWDFTGSTAGVAVTGGSAADTFTLDGGAGKDTVVYSATNISTVSLSDSIGTFDAAGEDKIDLKAFALTGDKTNVTEFTKAPVDGAAMATATAFFDDGADLIVYADTNNDGKFNEATDFSVKLTGLTTVNLDAADFIFA